MFQHVWLAVIVAPVVLRAQLYTGSLDATETFQNLNLLNHPDRKLKADFMDSNSDLIQKLIHMPNLNKLMFNFTKLESFLGKFICERATNWPGLNVNEQCVRSVKDWACNIIPAAMNQTDDWPLSVLDSAFKPPAGLTELNFKWMGSYDQCRDLIAIIDGNDTYRRQFGGRYCRFSFPAKLSENLKLLIKTGVCVPKLCTTDDMNQLAKDYLPFIELLLPGADLHCEESKKYYTDVWFLIATMICVCFISLSLIAAFVDYFRTKTQGNPDSLIMRLLLCFSLYTNGSRLVSTEQRAGSLDCIHGIRFISMGWVMYGHTYFFVLNFIANPSYAAVIPGQFLFQVINNATVSVDTFFVLSGFLLSYLFLQRMQKQGTAEMKSARFWIMYYVHRYIRLTPAYMIVIVLLYGFWDQLGEGPLWLSRDEHNGLVNWCPDYWWRNALYIQNLFEWGQQCIGWSWYLANDMQFYWITPPLLILLHYYPVVGISLASLVAIASNVARGITAYTLDLPPTVTSTIDPSTYISISTKHYSDIMYGKPWMRIAPYLIGVCFGYFMLKSKGRVKLNKLVVVLLWILMLALSNTVLFGLYGFASTGKIDPVASAFYLALNRSAWAVFVCSVIFMCLHGYGGPINSLLSWNAFFPLSRLTYCAYLCHEFFIYHVYAIERKPPHADHFYMFCMFAGATGFTYAAAACISLLFESPIMQLEKIIFANEPAVKTKRKYREKKTQTQKSRSAKNAIRVEPITESRI